MNEVSDDAEWSARRAIAFVKKHGVVLESGRGPVPGLAQAIAGRPFSGSWWKHPRRRAIFRATRAVRDSSDVLVCRLIGGKITFVHRRLWPLLVRLGPSVPAGRLDAIREQHTESGAHRLAAVPYPRWVPREVRTAAKALPESEVLRVIDVWLSRGRPARRAGTRLRRSAAAGPVPGAT